MNIATEQLFRMLEALGNASRFRMVLSLCERERHVSDLALEVGLSQSCTTRHLQVLERAGVVHARRAGRRVMAALALERTEVAQLAAWLRAAGAPDAYAAAPAGSASAPGGRGTTPRRGAGSGATGREGVVDRTRADGGTSATPVAVPAPRPQPDHPVRPNDMDDFLL